MRNRIALAFSFFSFISLASAGPAAADDRSTCAQRGSDDRIAACSRVIEKSGRRDAWAYDNRGAEYGNKGDYDRALADFNEAIRINPKFSLAHRDRGLVLVRKNEFERGIADLSEAIRLDPKNLDAYNERGMAYVATGDAERALADFNTAIRVNPKFKFAYYNRGRLFGNKGYFSRAIEDFSETIRIDPEFAMAYNYRGVALQQNGNTERAVADFSEAIRISPRLAVAYVNRGNVYRQQGRSDRALADYNEALRIEPQYTAALVNRGLTYERTADLARARADFDAALSGPQKLDGAKQAQDKARERVAALSDTSAKPPATTSTAVITLPGPSGSNDKRIALVIGNSAYENVAALANPARDAALVAEALKVTGFDSVTLQTDLRKDALTAALRDFARQAETADWAMVYYAGHGMEVGGVNYLIPIDARIVSDRDVSFEAVALEQVMNAAERAKRLRLVILDACRDNPFANQMKRTMTLASRSVSRGLAAIEPEAGTLVVYAAKDGEMALDGQGSNSPFATAFVTNMRKPGLEVRRLFDVVRDDVMEATNRAQKPFSYGSISGRQDFYFVATR
ncbi:tetratricopeptide repeat protein [Bradyrhizobium sp.]|uniref:tetratricopeptide repeat protein n=1 Tax=Bradyrhizobium sp. TaxID=376 RepID=UPI0040378551